MDERLQHMCLTVTDPDESLGMDVNEGYFIALFPMTIVGISVAPLEDDPGALLGIDDDAANVITGIDASDANVPGTWATPMCKGQEKPVYIAEGSLVSLDFTAAAVANTFYVHIWYLIGELL